jgi:heme/copper-type cytochrome/quinol oxidase subunit 2
MEGETAMCQKKKDASKNVTAIIISICYSVTFCVIIIVIVVVAIRCRHTKKQQVEHKAQYEMVEVIKKKVQLGNVCRN